MSEAVQTDGAAPAAAAAHGESSTWLAQRARMAIAWTTGFEFLWDVLQFGITMVLARLLAPAAYGEFGFILTFNAFATIFSCREILGHTLQVRGDRDPGYQHQFTAGAAIQGALFLIVAGIALALRFSNTYRAVSTPLLVASPLFLLDLPSELRNRMLSRELDWRRMRTVHGVGLLLAAALSIGMALLGCGVYALVVPLLVVPATASFDLFVNVGWRPTWEWNWAEYRAAWYFGISRTAGGGAVTGSSLMESSWLASTLGFTELGFFNRAVRLAQLSCQRVATILANSVYPVLTRIDPGTPSYQKAAGLLMKSVSWTVIPIAIVFARVALPAVLVVYGKQWGGVSPILGLALTIGATMAVVQIAYTLLLAHQRQRECLIADIWRLVGTALALVLCLPFGLRGYLAAMVGVHVIALVMILRWLIADKAIGARSLVDAFVPPAVAALAAWIPTELAFRTAGPITVWTAAPYAAMFGLIYLAVFRLFFARLLTDVVRYLPAKAHVGRLLVLPQID